MIPINFIIVYFFLMGLRLTLNGNDLAANLFVGAKGPKYNFRDILILIKRKYSC